MMAARAMFRARPRRKCASMKSRQVRQSDRVLDIRNELNTDQLAMIGAIALKYNDVEATIDVLLGYTLNLSIDAILEVTSRINGIEGKIEIAKAALAAVGASVE